MSKGRKLPEILCDSEVDAILNTFNLKCPSGLRNRVIVETMAKAGLRISEIINLRVIDVKLEKQLLTVKQGKGRKDRNVIFNAQLGYYLALWMQKRPETKKSDPFFTQITKGGIGRKVSQQQMITTVKRAAAKAGIDRSRVSNHCFRHFYACSMIGKIELHHLMQQLGHQNLSTTQQYLHCNNVELHKRIQELDQQEQSIDIKKNEKNSGTLIEKQVLDLQQIIKDAQSALKELCN